MSKHGVLFRVQNSDWIVSETAPGVYELSTADGSKKINGLSQRQIVTAQGVLAELERHITETGGK